MSETKEEKKAVVMTVLSTVLTVLGPVEFSTNLEALKSIVYLTFMNIKTPAKAKTPEMTEVMTTAEYSQLLGNLSQLEDTSHVSIVLGIAKKGPKFLAAAKAVEHEGLSTGEKILLMVNQLAEEVEKHTKSTSAIRDVKKSIVNKLAEIFLIAAGTSGEIPESMFLNRDFLSFALDAAREKALKDAEEKGKDENGQFRLKSPKAVKEEEKDAE